MSWSITKYLITAALVVAASEIAKRSDKPGALIVALPMVTIQMSATGTAPTDQSSLSYYR